MNEKLLYESEMLEASDNAPVTIAPGTGQTDISQQTPKTRLARNVVSQSLPFMVGFVQPLSTPSGFVFGFKDRKNTKITHQDFPISNQGTPSDDAGTVRASTTRNPADPMTDTDQPGLELPPYDGSNWENAAVLPTPTPAADDDSLIIRRLINTDVREVVFDMTNEVIQDINSLFGNDFPGILQKFITSGGELYGFPESDTDTGLSNFFLPQMISKAVKKINDDFTNWADGVSTQLGTVTINTLAEMPNIFTAIGEMREALSNSTNKSGSVFILCTPRIANYIAGTLGMTNSNGSDSLEIGKPNQNPNLNGFVGQFGDVYVYQYRGDRNTTIGTERIIMGFDGSNGPNTSSVYYHPYKEYLIQGGDDYKTGQSNVFYRVRDAWGVNPLDTFDESQTSPIQDPGNDLPSMSETSQYLIKADFNMIETAIIPNP